MNCNYFKSDTIEKAIGMQRHGTKKSMPLCSDLSTGLGWDKVKILPSLISVDQNGCFLRHA